MLKCKLNIAFLKNLFLHGIWLVEFDQSVSFYYWMEFDWLKFSQSVLFLYILSEWNSFNHVIGCFVMFGYIFRLHVIFVYILSNNVLKWQFTVYCYVDDVLFCFLKIELTS